MVWYITPALMANYTSVQVQANAASAKFYPTALTRFNQQRLVNTQHRLTFSSSMHEAVIHLVLSLLRQWLVSKFYIRAASYSIYVRYKKPRGIIYTF